VKEYIISADEVESLEEVIGTKMSFPKECELIRCKDCPLQFAINSKHIMVCLARTNGKMYAFKGNQRQEFCPLRRAHGNLVKNER
jgi:hypothetical protein